MAVRPGIPKRAPSNDDRDWNHLVYGWAEECNAITAWLLDPGNGAQYPWSNFFANENIQRHDITMSDINLAIYQLDYSLPGGFHWEATFSWSVSDTVFYVDGIPATVLLGIVLEGPGFNKWIGKQVELRPPFNLIWSVPIFGAGGSAADWTSPLVLTPAQLFLP